MKRHFSEEHTHMADKQRCSTSLAIRKMQIKTLISYYTPIKMLHPHQKKKSDTKCWQGDGEPGSFIYN